MEGKDGQRRERTGRVERKASRIDRLTFNQFILLLLGSYVESSVSNILTINPSHESLTLSSKNA